MPGKMIAELKQSKPFQSLQEEAYLNVLRTADALGRHLDQLLKRRGLTATQYNVLRILRGAGAGGATCRDIGERLINAEPDVTRLLDRMERLEVIARRRNDQDRRFVTVRITDRGLKLLAELDRPIQELHKQQFARLSEEELIQLIAGLEKTREGLT